MSGKPHILIIDDDIALCTVLERALQRAGYAVRCRYDARQIEQLLDHETVDLIISDVRLPGESAFSFLPRLLARRPGLPVIVTSAQNSFETAIRAGELGAADYLSKPFDLNELTDIVERSLKAGNANIVPSGASPAGDQDGASFSLIGRSAPMQELYRLLARLAQTNLSVMITGESGTGKELVARALHLHGKRKNGPFIAVNMAAISHDLIESELFGHEKGAFTGAHSQVRGRFEQADGGTLFLDEIGDMPMDAQTRLLRVLQDCVITRVGGSKPIRCDVRIVAATHQDPLQLIHLGRFREDLFYRLNVVPVRMPPLSARREDIAELAHFFLRKAGRENDVGPTQLNADAMRTLSTHQWPGNVRELENFIRRVSALYPQMTLDRITIERQLALRQPPASHHEASDKSDHHKTEMEKTPISPTDQWLEDNDLAAEDGLCRALNMILRKHLALHAQAPASGLYQRVIREVELPLISAVLEYTGANQIRAADILGLSRNTLRKKIRELAIRPGFSGNGAKDARDNSTKHRGGGEAEFNSDSN